MTTSLHSLSQSAMLGTGNGFAPPVLEHVNLPDSSPESALLASAAVIGIGELGGFVPATVEITQTPCPAESKAQMSLHAGQLLERILGGEFEATLPEFLQLTAARGLLVPPETIPALLGLGKRELRPLVTQVAGERGRWLAAHNPSWAYALGREPLDAWEHGTQIERLDALVQVRSGDPVKARAWVQETWEQDSPEDRASFLSAFSTGLSMEDEPFLESCLDDRRKEVRDAARALLLRLEDSRFVQRNWARVKPLLKLQTKLLSKDALQVTLPEEPDRAAKRDGLGSISFRKKMGEKANLLAQMLSLVPPALWSREFDRSPEKLLAATLGGEWQEPVMLGWQWATQEAQDVAWAEALAPLWLTLQKQAVLDPDRLEGIVTLMRAEKLEALLQASIKPLVGELDDKNPLIFLLEKYRRPWTVKMARSVVKSAQRQSGDLRYNLPQILPGLAHWFPPELAGEFASGWAAEPKGHWRDRIDTFLMILNFRNEIRESLEQEAP